MSNTYVGLINPSIPARINGRTTINRPYSPQSNNLGTGSTVIETSGFIVNADIYGTIYNNNNTIFVDNAGSDTQRGFNLITSYNKAKLLSNLGSGNRATIVIPAGSYLIEKTGIAPGFILDTDYIDLVGETGDWRNVFIYSYSLPNGTQLNTAITGPTIRQTSIDTRLSGLWISCMKQGTSSFSDSQINRSFEIQSKLMASGISGDGSYLSQSQYWLYSASLGIPNKEFLNIKTGDYVQMSGGSLSKIASFQVIDLDTTDDGVRLDYSYGAGLSKNQVTFPETSTSNISWRVYRTNAPSYYKNCNFSTVNEIFATTNQAVNTAFSLFSSPWGIVHLDGTWEDCIGTINSWRVNTFGHMFGTYTRCKAGDLAFVGDGTPNGTAGTDNTHYAWLSARMYNCEGGDYSYASCTSFGGYSTSNTLLKDCISGKSSVCVGREFKGQIIGGKYGIDSIAGYSGNEANNSSASVSLMGRFSGSAYDVYTDGGDSFGQGIGNIAYAVSGTMCIISPNSNIIRCQNGPYGSGVTLSNNSATIQYLPLASGVTYNIRAKVNAYGTNLGAIFDRSWIVISSGLYPSITEIPSESGISRVGLTTADISLITHSQGLQLRVTGETSKTITWKVVSLDWFV